MLTIERPGPDFLICNDLLPPDARETLRTLARSETGWTRYEELYSEWVVHTFERKNLYRSAPALQQLRAAGAYLIEREFAAVLGAHHKILAHRIERGEAVAPHNDSPACSRAAPQYRLILFPNHPRDVIGGDFLLHIRKRVAKRIPATSNVAVLIRLSSFSEHSVDEVKSGLRHSIIISYWGYPVLHTNKDDAYKVRRCLQAVITAGLEEIEYADTTLARHLYRTYEWLARHEAPLKVCLAGLLHEIPEFPSANASLHADLAATDALRILDAFRSPASIFQSGPLWDDVALVKRAAAEHHGGTI